MIKLNEHDILLEFSDYTNNYTVTEFNITKKIPILTTQLVKIDFNNNYDFAIKIFKILIKYSKNLGVPYEGYNLIGFVQNYNSDILDGFKALCIKDIKKRYNFIYDTVTNYLDTKWKKYDPCKFCNNICIASRNHMTSHKENGCCYSFKYSKNPFGFIKDIKLCQFLENGKCTTSNISCKLFTCNYLKSKKNLAFNISKIFLLNCFFDNKQKLILKYNFFNSKQSIINKLLEKHTAPLIFFYLFSYYRIN